MSIKDEIYEDKPPIKQGWLRALLFFISLLILTGIVQALMFFLTGKVEDAINKPDSLYSLDFFLRSQFFSMLCTLVLSAIFIKTLDKRTFSEYGIKLKGKTKELLKGGSLGIVMIGIGVATLWLFGYLTFMPGNMTLKTFSLFLLMFIFTAINEEVMIRGYILTNLRDSMNKYVALVFSSVLFIIMHAMNPDSTWIAFIN
ncbi:MAG: CPBP family intramembrane glutamic endopeptidase, partial [Flavobacteriales bacterium]